MSKELIEKLREDGKFLGGNFGKLMIQAADALEAKAAPVGEWTPATTFPPFGEIVLTNHGPAYMTEKQPGVWFERLENLGIGRRLGAGAVKQWRLRRESEAKVDTQAAVIAELQAENARLREGQEPVAYITGYHGGWCIIEPVNRAAVLPSGMALYATPQPSAVQGVNQKLLEALEELEEAARQVMAGEMATSRIMVERMKARAAITAALAEITSEK